MDTKINFLTLKKAYKYASDLCAALRQELSSSFTTRLNNLDTKVSSCSSYANLAYTRANAAQSTASDAADDAANAQATADGIVRELKSLHDTDAGCQQEFWAAKETAHPGYKVAYLIAQRFNALSATSKINLNFAHLIKYPNQDVPTTSASWGRGNGANTDVVFLPDLDYSTPQNMAGVYRSLGALTHVPDIKAPAATTLCSTFAECKALQTSPSIQAPRCTNFSGIFGHCVELVTISTIDVSAATMLNCFAYNCPKVTTINLTGFGTPETLEDYWEMESWSPGLSNAFKGTKWGTGSDEARQSLIDTLLTHSFDRAAAGYEPWTVRLANVTKAVLTDEEKAQIAAKGYTIA